MSSLGQAIPMGLIHGTCVVLSHSGEAALLIGPSGSGKSDLALRLIDRGWVLVADDQVHLARVDGKVSANPPSVLAGKLAVCGLGIAVMPFVAEAKLALIVHLEDNPPRFPLEKSVQSVCGIHLPCIRLNAHAASAPMRVEMALRQAQK